MLSTENQQLFSKHDISDNVHVPKWLKQEYQNFQHKVLDPGFPCQFGTVAEKQKKIYYAYLHHKEDPMLSQILSEFLEINRKFNNSLGLALFLPPEENRLSFEAYQSCFWDILDLLHKKDTLSWPEEQIENPNEPLWNFCFHGEPLFIFANFPAYQNRKSRNLGNSMVIMMQSIDVFNGIEPGSPTGTKTRLNIRERIKEFDGIQPHPNLGHPRAVVKHPWKLYVLSDDMEKERGQCPFHKK